MADTKISALTDGTSVQSTDVIPAVRAGGNVRVPFGSWQPLDSDLTAIAALTTTSFGRAFLALADAAAARTATGLVIGTDVEAHDADLTTIAGLSPTNDDVMQRKAGGWVNRSLAQLMTDLAALGTTFQPLDSDLTAIAALTTTSTGRSLLAAADAAAIRTIAGSQALDATLTALAALTTAANKLIYATGSDTFSTTDFTAFARTLLDDADAATMLATLGAQPIDSDLTAIAALTTTSYGRSFLSLADAAAALTLLGITQLSAPSDANFFVQRNSGNTADEYQRRYFSFVIPIPGADGTEPIWQAPTNQGVTITGAHGWTNAGTTTLAIKIGSTSITGLSALSLTSTEGTDTAGTAANVMAGDDKLNAVLSSTSGVTTVRIRVQGYVNRATA